jgi:type I restriction enzyme S subunit
MIDGDWVESKDQDPDGDVRLTQLADVGIAEFMDKSARFMNIATARRLNCTFLKANDVLVARMPDPIGRACIFPGSNQQCVTVVDVCIVRPDPAVADYRYLNWAINSEAFQRNLWAYIKGSTRQRISRKNLESVSVALPPLAEQMRIAAVLDQTNELRRQRRTATELLRQLPSSIFRDMFGDPSKQRTRWPQRRLGEIGELERGVSKHRPRNDPSLLNGPYPLVQTGDIANCDGYVRSYSGTYSETGLRQSRLWPRGTLCITIAANIGKTGILTFDACFPDSVVGFTPHGSVRTEYVQTWLSFVQRRLEADAPQFAQKNINLATLRELLISVPPLHLQDQFVERTNRVRGLQVACSGHLSKLHALFASLQDRAFRGQLTSKAAEGELAEVG